MVKYNGKEIDYKRDIETAIREGRLVTFANQLERNEIERLSLKEQVAQLNMKIAGMRANAMKKITK